MILQNYAQGNGECLATLAIKVNRGQFKPVIAYYNSFCNDEIQAKQFFNKCTATWIRSQLHAFATQRHTALAAVNMLSLAAIDRINNVKTLYSYHHLGTLCSKILRMQDDIRLLVPSPTSPQYYWHYVMEEIIHFAHSATTKHKSTSKTNSNIYDNR